MKISKTMGLLRAAALLSDMTDVPMGKIKSFDNPPPNGNNQRKHKENVIRRRKRRLVKKARSIQRAA